MGGMKGCFNSIFKRESIRNVFDTTQNLIALSQSEGNYIIIMFLTRLLQRK